MAHYNKVVEKRGIGMITRIGIVSGDILNLLENQNRPMHLKDFDTQLQYPSAMILMSIGWLAREGYVRLEEEKEEDFLVSQI